MAKPINNNLLNPFSKQDDMISFPSLISKSSNKKTIKTELSSLKKKNYVESLFDASFNINQNTKKRNTDSYKVKPNLKKRNNKFGNDSIYS